MKYEYWFANIKGISNQRKYEIRQGINQIEMLYYIEETALSRYPYTEAERKAIIDSIRTWQLDKEYQKLEEKNIRFITRHQSSYPKRLHEIGTAPYALYVKGQLPKEDTLTVAIVGARECSPYGETMAHKFGETLANAGVQIVSGMARGVDSAGQRGALLSGGTSFAVLGCGVDICYPREQIGLYMELQQDGGILSEFPIGTRPLPQHFPARNRIISGLSDVVLVMEAKEKSGSLITADMALEQGKDVYALPGPVNSVLSRGCNYLIRQGAGVLLSPEELMEDLGILSQKKNKKICQKKLLLETRENLVYSCLDFQPRNLETLMEMTKLSITELVDIIMSLELKGCVKEISKNYYVKLE